MFKDYNMFKDVALLKINNSNKQDFDKLVQLLEDNDYKVIKLEERTFFTEYLIAEVK